MYNLRLKNFLCLCPCAINRFFDNCTESIYFHLKTENNDLVISRFNSMKDAEIFKESLKLFFNDFCFLCTDDCGYRIQYKIENGKQ